MGCDLNYLGYMYVPDVSIHAPAWGATKVAHSTFSFIKFQSTHPHGVRRTLGVVIALSHKFQSTHPHGVRQSADAAQKRIFSFNPRTRMGCDKDGKDERRQQRSFNPRTRMGCDLLKSSKSTSRILFQSTHPHGVRPYTQQ